MDRLRKEVEAMSMHFRIGSHRHGSLCRALSALLQTRNRGNWRDGVGQDERKWKYATKETSTCLHSLVDIDMKITELETLFNETEEKEEQPKKETPKRKRVSSATKTKAAPKRRKEEEDDEYVPGVEPSKRSPKKAQKAAASELPKKANQGWSSFWYVSHKPYFWTRLWNCL